MSPEEPEQVIGAARELRGIDPGLVGFRPELRDPAADDPMLVPHRGGERVRPSAGKPVHHGVEEPLLPLGMRPYVLVEERHHLSRRQLLRGRRLRRERTDPLVHVVQVRLHLLVLRAERGGRALVLHGFFSSGRSGGQRGSQRGN
jgi:hypothetical protein